MGYKLTRFTEKTATSTEQTWTGQAKQHETDYFPPEIEKDFAWIRQKLAEKNKDGTVHYGLFGQSQVVADGVAELVYTQKTPRSAWLKMLELYFSPEVTAKAAAGDQEAVLQVTEMFTAAVVGCIKLTGTHHKADTLKLYGRTDGLLQYFKVFAASLKIKNVTLTVEGRWLVFRYTK